MNQTETAKIMKLIQSQYRNYCKEQDEVKFALSVMNKLFEPYQYQLIEKALIKFMQNDAKGFPPVPGQLITLANEIRKSEWEQKQREMQQLPEPKVNAVPMPDEIREKLEQYKSAFKL